MKAAWLKYFLAFFIGVAWTVIAYEEWLKPGAIALAIEEVELREIANEFNRKNRAEIDKFLQQLHEKS
jgi:hypothetical protein